MNNTYFYFRFFTFLFPIILFSCQSTNETKVAEDESSFKFVFMTDIHLQPERRATEGFSKAIDSVNKFNPDFVITGGDLIMDALGQNFKRSDELYNLYKESLKTFNMPVYNTMGNHEIFGIYKESGVDKSHPEYGEKMYENRIGKRYYSFNHKGWHFVILDAIEDTGESSYIGKVDEVQMDWIKTDLKEVDPMTPIIISVHIPFITSYMQILYGSLEPNDESLVITNSKAVLDLYKNHNLKLVLQGHLHYVEDIYANGIHFITGGAVSSKWWRGKENGMEEGFLIVYVKGNTFEWEYFDYGWEAENEQD